MSRTGAATSAARRVRAGRGPTRRRPHTGATSRFRPPAGSTVSRRYSGSASRARPRGDASIAVRARGALRIIVALPDLPVVDRAVRGRTWIAVVGALLIGVVALQVAMLKINAGIGRAVQRTTALERDKAKLEASMAGASSAERIRAKAERLGMVLSPERVRYVSARGSGPMRATAAALAAGDFASRASAAAVQSDPSTADSSTADSSGSSSASGSPSTSEAQAMLNDGDPSNDVEAMLNDGDPSNDARAMLNDGDPSNDDQALLDDGDPSNDAQAPGGGN